MYKFRDYLNTFLHIHIKQQQRAVGRKKLEDAQSPTARAPSPARPPTARAPSTTTRSTTARTSSPSWPFSSSSRPACTST
uniref:Uncharacterized protein n=1 Tax=Populus trichocarpa TaxID=3694 RepID=A0A3N7HY53_POPTR